MRTASWLARIAAVALLTCAAPAMAQFTVMLQAGYAGSEGIENTATNAKAQIENSAAYGVALGTVLDDRRELLLLYRQQSTTLTPGAGAAPFDLTIRYLQVGGTVFMDNSVGKGPYVFGALGATQFSPSTSGYGDEYKPSLSLGLGYAWPLGERIDLRAEARAYFTFVNSSGGFLCAGGCIVVLSSDVFTQYEALVSLAFRF